MIMISGETFSQSYFNYLCVSAFCISVLKTCGITFLTVIISGCAIVFGTI